MTVVTAGAQGQLTHGNDLVALFHVCRGPSTGKKQVLARPSEDPESSGQRGDSELAQGDVGCHWCAYGSRALQEGTRLAPQMGASPKHIQAAWLSCNDRGKAGLDTQTWGGGLWSPWLP